MVERRIDQPHRKEPLAILSDSLSTRENRKIKKIGFGENRLPYHDSQPHNHEMKKMIQA